MKTLKIVATLFILFLLQSSQTKAQHNKKYSAIYNLINVNSEFFLSNDFYDKTIVFSINIGINKYGAIDTVIYSSKDDEDINRAFNLKRIAAGLKADKTNFKSNKNEFLSIMIVLLRGERYFIELKNGDQYLANWMSISKTYDYIQNTGRRQIMLSPIIIDFRGKSIKDRIEPLKNKTPMEYKFQ